VLVVGGLRRACVGLVGPEGSIPPTLPAADSVRAQRAGEAVCAGAAARGGCKHDPAAKAEGMRRVSMMSSGLVTYPTKPHPSCAPGAHTAQEGSASWRAAQGKGGGRGGGGGELVLGRVAGAGVGVADAGEAGDEAHGES
jgi:hypothetical protein